MTEKKTTVNQPLTQKVNLTHGHHRYMPLKEFHGKRFNEQGEREAFGKEVWYDFKTDQAYPAGDNWNAPPPSLPSGDPGREPRCRMPSRTYRDKYSLIFGHD